MDSRNCIVKNCLDATPEAIEILEFPKASDVIAGCLIYISLELMDDPYAVQDMLNATGWKPSRGEDIIKTLCASYCSVEALLVCLWENTGLYSVHVRFFTNIPTDYLFVLRPKPEADKSKSSFVGPSWANVIKPCPRCGVRLRMLFSSMYCPSCNYEEL